MSRIWIKGLSAVVLAALLSACATSKEKLLTHHDATMLDIWNQETGAVPAGPGDRRLSNARQVLRRPLTEAEARTVPAITASYTRTAQNEIVRQFQRLPNPDLVMYVFPHLVGSDPVPVPGYSTVFPLYQRVQYALPGERIENY